MNGWIQLHRKFIEWEWYDDANTMRLFIHLLLLANHKPNKWHGSTIDRGQVVTGRKELSKQLSISQRSIRTSLDKLKSTSELTIKTTNKFSIVTICNYDKYQQLENTNDQQNDQQKANKRPTNDQQTTTPEKDKKDKKVNNTKKSIEERKNEFYATLIPFVDVYGKEMLRAFFEFFSEPTKGDNPKMKMELEKTWLLSSRLARWKRMEKPKFASSNGHEGGFIYTPPKNVVK